MVVIRALRYAACCIKLLIGVDTVFVSTTLDSGGKLRPAFVGATFMKVDSGTGSIIGGLLFVKF